MAVNPNNINGWAISQEMQNGDFKWLSQDNCNDIRLLLNYAEGRIAIFDTKVFDHRKIKED